MTLLDEKILPKVKEVLETYGIDVTLISYTRVHTEFTNEVVETPVETTIRTSPPYNVDAQLVSLGTYQVGDLTFIMAGQDAPIVPTTSMRIMYDGRPWTIIAVTPYVTGEQVAAWEIVARK